MHAETTQKANPCRDLPEDAPSVGCGLQCIPGTGGLGRSWRPPYASADEAGVRRERLQPDLHHAAAAAFGLQDTRIR